MTEESDDSKSDESVAGATGYEATEESYDSKSDEAAAGATGYEVKEKSDDSESKEDDNDLAAIVMYFEMKSELDKQSEKANKKTEETGEPVNPFMMGSYVGRAESRALSATDPELGIIELDRPQALWVRNTLKRAATRVQQKWESAFKLEPVEEAEDIEQSTESRDNEDENDADDEEEASSDDNDHKNDEDSENEPMLVTQFYHTSTQPDELPATANDDAAERGRPHNKVTPAVVDINEVFESVYGHWEPRRLSLLERAYHGMQSLFNHFKPSRKKRCACNCFRFTRNRVAPHPSEEEDL